MDLEEAALLAELRAISDRSAGSRRFQAGDDDTDPVEAARRQKESPLPSPRHQNNTPQQQQQQQQSMTDADMVATTMSRGGHDPLNAAASAATTTSNNNNNDQDEIGASSWRKTLAERIRQQPPKPEAAAAGSADLTLVVDKAEPVEPPAVARVADNSSDAMMIGLEATRKVAASPTHTTASSAPAASSTFGGRGGDANDPELLALLRSVSNKSSSTSRFAASSSADDTTNNDDGMQDSTSNTVVLEPPTRASQQPPISPSAVSKSRQQSAQVPPWKRIGGQQQSANDDVVVAAPRPPPKRSTLDTPTTYSGERGGDANDAELLALLRGVSNNSAASRFGDEDDADAAFPSGPMNGDEEAFPIRNTRAGAKTLPSKQSSPSNATNVALPPWKRGKQKADIIDMSNTDTLVLAPSTRNEGFKSDIPSATFSGERGGNANDPELLALLRGVSNKSGASRFDNDDGTMAAAESIERSPTRNQPPKQSIPSKNGQEAMLPPWKLGKQHTTTTHAADIDIVVAAPPPSMGGFKSDLPSTFNGERGGEANDPELLALLRGASSAAATANRFGDDQVDEVANNDEKLKSGNAEPAPAAPAGASSTASKFRQAMTPPWKRSKEKDSPVQEEPANIAVAAPPIQEAFTGERGGDANDPELLALLRGVSSKAAASRFDDEETAEALPHINPRQSHAESVTIEKSALKQDLAAKVRQAVIPPWKRGKQGSRIDSDKIDIVIAASPQAQSGIKSDLPSSFAGERGGDANDPELLALLKGVSSNAGASRFDDDAADIAPDVGTERQSSGGDAATKSIALIPSFPSKLRQAAATPPWKRKEEQSNFEQEELASDTTAFASQSAPVGNFKADTQSTYTGERGGEANDAELLALLRGVSNKTSASRFDDDVHTFGTKKDGSPSGQSMTTKPQDAPDVIGSPIAKPAVAKTADVTDQAGLAMDNLASAVVDKDWKVRSAALEALGNILLQTVDGRERVWDVNADQILDGLDQLLPKLLAESNANALDKALGFALLYAEHCRGASAPEQARAIVSVLINSHGFPGRPGTAKLASSVVLKLVEVGSVASVNAIIGVLLADGLASKKPKVIQAAVILIFDAAIDFGATVLPLAVIISSAPKILANQNAKVRETGIKILAEICRALGSKDPLTDIISGMKPAQAKELDHLLLLQPEATQPCKVLRQHAVSSRPAPTALEALHAGVEELAAQNYAARPTINLMSEVAKSEYSSRLGLSKWSEKVAALNVVLELAGEKPYKLATQSSTCNYIPLINDAKKLLPHTHFAVVSKALEILSMLAIGVGDKLFSHLRPLLLPLLLLSKDKKLTKAVSSCLDALFGNILGFDHLLDQDDAIPDATDENKQKNALVRTAALEFLTRSVQRAEKAGPRSSLSIAAARRSATIATDKLEDSNADVRKAASEMFKALQDIQESQVVEFMAETLASLASRNPRACKALSRGVGPVPKVPKDRLMQKPEEPGHADINNAAIGSRTRRTVENVEKPKIKPPADQTAARVAVNTSKADAQMSMSTAIMVAENLAIPLWSALEEDGGILKGLESAKGIMRQDAIKALTAFIASGKLFASDDIDRDCTALLIVVREHTRGLNETNVNIMRGIIQLLLAMIDVHEKMGRLINHLFVKAGSTVAIAKISDKKASDGCKSLLSALCLVADPISVLLAAFETLQLAKSPVAHEEYLKWIISFCGEFGAMSLGRHIGDLIPFLLQELVSSNPKVKRESSNALGVLHSHLGSQFRSLVVSMAKPPVREQVESSLDAFPFNEALQSMNWPKASLAAISTNGSSGLQLDIPKVNLIDDLPEDIVVRLGSKDGKTAWKQRKEALEEVDTALKRCSGLVETGGNCLKPVIELARSLEQRLTDTQINLKPIASSAIARLLSVVDTPTQARIGKIVFSQLINSAMNDIKKPMRDSCLQALQCGVTCSPLDGGKINVDALEVFVASLIGEVNEASTRAGGLSDVLLFIHGLTNSLPNLDNITSTRGEPLGERYAFMIVECLTSSKAETRSAATMIVEASIERGVVSVGSFRKASDRLKPAQQRTVGPVIAKFTKRTDLTSETGKENDESLIAPPAKATAKGALPKLTEQKSTSDLPTMPDNKSCVTHGKATEPEHPLMTRVGSRTAQQVSKPLVWPEYPEEPHGASLIATLKRAWSAVLPVVSAAKLFPDLGISKYDDALAGVELLAQSVDIDRSSKSKAVEAQLEFIFKWIAVVLCSRESTVGLVSLLDLIESMLQHLAERKYHLKDSEAVLLVPFLVEKSGLSKGRFREKFTDIDQLLLKEHLLTTKQFGSLICVNVLENSSQAKARAHACRLCMICLEKEGLTSVGKKGVLVIAKALSDETIPENKSLALDLMELVLERMKGDFQKLVRVCGTSLSSHGLQLLEERWVKRENQPIGSLKLSASEILDRPESPTEVRKESVALLTTEEGQGAGAAAALRARLVALRQKGSEAAPSQRSTEADQSNLDLTFSAASVDVEMLYEASISGLESLMSLDLPLREDNKHLQSAIDSLKKFHASLSMQQKSFPGLTVPELKQLRQIISEHIAETMEQLTHLIRFSFDCGDPSINAGMSIPLLSVCLATLMATFRDPDVSATVSQDQLGILLRETGTALLDPRLSSNKDINETTGSQMVRAINKLAVQAATGAERHTSLLALLALQQQISLADNHKTTADEDALNSRLSRILSKLFIRVIKTEEIINGAFNRQSFDLEAVLCGLEDYLVACSSAIGKKPVITVDACRDMAAKLAKALVDAHGPEMLCDILEDLELLQTTEFVLSLCSGPDSAANRSDSFAAVGQVLPKNRSERSSPQEDADNSMDVSSLVSALASSKSEQEKTAALAALRKYEQLHGDGDLQAHLQKVSSPFRTYIERQLSGDAMGDADRDTQQETDNGMSERIRNLRSRIAATDATGQTALTPDERKMPHRSVDSSMDQVYRVAIDMDSSPASPPETLGTMDLNPLAPKHPSPKPVRSSVTTTSRLARPSPSKLAAPLPSKLGGGAAGSSLNFRDRLAQGDVGGGGPKSPLRNPSAAMSRAAELRARLDAVKAHRPVEK